MSSVAFLTIIAKNYLAHARVLMQSVAEHHPDAPRVVVLVDTVDGYFDPSNEPFTVIESKDIGIPNWEWFHFQYDILERSTGVKPYAMSHVLQMLGVESVVYLDPDIRLYAPVTPVLDALRESNVVLTPHLVTRGPSAQESIERHLLRTGAYNLGFVAVRSGPEGKSFLAWWCEKLAEQCLVDLPSGLFVDQKWIDLAPGLFDRVEILRDSGLNVAWWNLRTRAVTSSDGGYAVNGTPLQFFHFSGFDPTTPSILSKHQDQLDVGGLGAVAEILGTYARELLSHGYEQSREWRCTYSFYSDGASISDVTRRVLVQREGLNDLVSDPFSTEGSVAVHEVWNQPVTRADGCEFMTLLARHIYSLEPELRAAMPDPFGVNWQQFLEWVVDSGSTRYGLTPDLVSPLRELIGERSGSVAPTNQNSARYTELALWIYDSREDLRRKFPDIGQRDALGYLSWLSTYGAKEHAIDDENRASLQREWRRLLALSSFARGWWYRVRRAGHGILARRIRT